MGWLKNPFPTSSPCSQSIRLARIPVFCLSICCCQPSCSRTEEILRVGRANNGVVSSSLSPVSAWRMPQLIPLPTAQNKSQQAVLMAYLENYMKWGTCALSSACFPPHVTLCRQLSNKGKMSWEWNKKEQMEDHGHEVHEAEETETKQFTAHTRTHISCSNSVMAKRENWITTQTWSC